MKVHEADKAAAGAEVRTLLLADPSLLAQVGEHRETIVPMGNGITEVLVRLQKATSVKVTDDALSVLRAKLGAVVDAYTITTVSLAPGALESLYTMGYITKQDVEDLTSVTSTESLIIKDASSKPKTIRSSKTKKTL